MVDYLIIDYMPSPCNLPHERWSSQISGNCNLSLKYRPTGRNLWWFSKPLSCLFEGNMAHDFHKPENIYRNSEPFPEDAPKVQGYDFNQGVDHKALLKSFFNTGFQATHFGRAVQEINRMVRRLKPPADCDQISSELKKLPQNCPMSSPTDRETQATVERYWQGRQWETSTPLPLPEQLHHLPGLHLKHDQQWRQGEYPLPRPAQNGTTCLSQMLNSTPNEKNPQNPFVLKYSLLFILHL